MAETQNAAIAPDESEAQRQDGEDRIQRDLQKLEQIEHERQNDHQGDADHADRNEPGIRAQNGRHRLPRK